MRSLAVGLLVVLAGCVGPVAELGPEGTDGTTHAYAWRAHPDGPVARAEVASAVVGTEVVIVGGFTTDGAATGLTDAFDTATNSWRSLPPYPFPVHHAAAVAVESGGAPGIYVFGGWSSPPIPDPRAPILPVITALVFRLDPAGGDWTPVGAMPAPRAGHAAALVDGKVYLVGGLTERFELTPTVDVYDPAADAWSTVPDLPTPRDHLAAVGFAGRVHVLAGQELSHAAVLSAHEAFDPATGEWETLAPVPTARNALVATPWDGRILTAGGQTDVDVFDTVEVWDPTTDTWTTLAPLPGPRHGGAAGSVGDRAYTLLGGTIAGSPEDLSPTVASFGPG